MSDLPRNVPTTHQEFADALDKGVFPDERYWIDFKRQLYPTPGPSGKNTQGEKQKAHTEIARDMASMATRGGYLVLGVAEDKSTTPPVFSPHPMPLPPGIKDDLDHVAKDRITPSLYVEVTPMEDPANPGTGFILIEIPGSEHAPHMTDERYFGRSDSGRTTLSDDQVERLMLQRAQLGQRIQPEMQTTAQADPIEAEQRGVPHGYLTAVPTHGWTDMFANYTKDRQAHQQLIQLCSQAAIRIVNESGQHRRFDDIAMGDMNNYRRSGQPHGAWLSTWTDGPAEGVGRMVGVDDDGPIRFIDLAAGSTFTGRHAIVDMMAARNPDYRAPTGPPLVYEMTFRDRVNDMLRLVTELSGAISYPGGWLLGVHFDGLQGRTAQATQGQRSFMAPSRYDADTYTFTTKATARQIAENPADVSKTLLLRLYRGLGTAALLDGPQQPGTA
ncbi:AlbA family DNA-binding domain-containing protein [Actinacidiphila soli]|uniref:AlbA family DNA-binding domain-containing protein n=1 Tax=Actinacidiphila soli TaxID=2487275 RepID=UPI000FCCAF64|nr:ATP-binding protein [Actinacidiphila soli]